MTSPFQFMQRRLSAVVANLYGEVATHIPRQGIGYATPGADPIRQEQPLTVVAAISPGIDLLTGTRAQGGAIAGGSQIATAKSEIWINATQLEALLYPVAHKDLIVLTSRPGSPTFEISVPPTKNHMGDMRLLVTAVGPS